VRARTLAGTAAAGLLLAAAAAGNAAANPYALEPDVHVSGASALVGCTSGGSDAFEDAYDNTEVEPQVAVNPTNPEVIVGASQQDRWPDGGARGLTSWGSTNGAASWAKLPTCPGAPARAGRRGSSA
jgi:ABC-type phosphate transport system substrate-binding protein